MIKNIDEANAKQALEVLDAKLKNLVSKSFNNGTWAVPASQKPLKQQEVRAIKFEAQTIKEKFASLHGSDAEKRNLVPLVLRREYLGTSAKLQTSDLKLMVQSWMMQFQPDGELFTFEKEPEFVEIQNVPFCGCGQENSDTQSEDEILQHRVECPNAIIKTDRREIFRTKHVRGSWFCRGCLNTAPTDPAQVNFGNGLTLQVNGFNPTKVISWCPKFIPDLGYLGPINYAMQIRKNNADIPICFGGLLHSQFSLKDGYAELTSMCDTCGHNYSEKKELPKAVEPSTELVVDMDSERALEAAKLVDELDAALKNNKTVDGCL